MLLFILFFHAVFLLFGDFLSLFPSTYRLNSRMSCSKTGAGRDLVFPEVLRQHRCCNKKCLKLVVFGWREVHHSNKLPQNLPEAEPKLLDFSLFEWDYWFIGFPSDPPTKFLQVWCSSPCLQLRGQDTSTALCLRPPSPLAWRRWEVASRRFEDTVTWQKPFTFSVSISLRNA